MVVADKYRPRRWCVGLVAGIVALGASGIAPAGAQSVPIVVPSIAPIVVGIPAGAPIVVVGIPGTGGATGRADVDVDVDINRHHGRAAVR